LEATSKVEKKEAGMMPTWAFPIFGMIAMFSFGAVVAMRARRRSRSTREIQVVDPDTDLEEFAKSDGEPLLNEDMVE